ncbi:MAG: VOC family protein [Saprospiraceae bacterium]|nr:VOC family protein [Saprospiraceae bacterium]
MEGKIVGIGGIFFKCKDAAATKKWYGDHCGIKSDQWGASFVQRKVSEDSLSFLQWSPFPHDTSYFFSEEQEFMVNYRVQHLETLVANLKSSGCEILDEIATYDYGKFVHIRDVDGRAVELWEPGEENLAEIEAVKKTANFE